MARGKKRTPQVEELRSYVEGVAKNLVEKLYGPEGPAWGTKLTQIEDVLLEIREMLTEKMLDESLAKQAAGGERAEAFRTCPGCQTPLPCGEANPRILQTRAGEAEWAEPESYCPRCRRAFFPQSRSLGIDQSETSPALLAKITYAGTAGRSFAEASALLQRLADLPTPEKQVERVTRRIGAERVAEREAAAAAFAALPLAKKFGVPAGVTPPDLAVVMADGGRLQIRDAPKADPVPAASDVALPAAGGTAAREAEEWDEESEAACRSGHWREDKIGLLLTMTSAEAKTDPCPDIPASFLDVVRIPKLVRELSKHVKEGEDGVADAAEPEAAAEALAEEAKYQPPKVGHRQVVASRQTWPAFASLLAQAAWASGFQQAARKAFLGDGSANNWKLQRRFFGSFTAILDFIHALSYVFAAAMAGRRFAAGWAVYEQWIGWVWRGRVTEVIAALEARQAELGAPAEDEPETSPRRIVAKTLTYLSNHQDKVRYDEYRRQGLPITSSHVESVVKQINQRVKGTEKFWSEDGSEAVLQLRADYLSDGQPLEAFWQRRQEAATGQRCYRRAG